MMLKARISTALSLLLAAILLLGCGGAGNTGANTGATTAPTATIAMPAATPVPATPTPLPSSPTPTLVSDTSGNQSWPAAADAAVKAATSALASQLAIAQDAIIVANVTATQWPDRSIGCPRRGVNYIQVVTPGYKIVLQTSGAEYEFHTDNSGQIVVNCTVANDSDAQPVTEAAKADLAQRLKIDSSAIQVVSVTKVTWPDGSRGCPKMGVMYNQIVSPGYIITLSANGQQYEYHTSATSDVIILCQGGHPTP
jgi:hypothetical protein